MNFTIDETLKEINGFVEELEELQDELDKNESALEQSIKKIDSKLFLDQKSITKYLEFKKTISLVKIYQFHTII